MCTGFPVSSETVFVGLKCNSTCILQGFNRLGPEPIICVFQLKILVKQLIIWNKVITKLKTADRLTQMQCVHASGVHTVLMPG